MRFARFARIRGSQPIGVAARRKRAPLALTLALVVAAGIVAACSGGDDDAATPTPVTASDEAFMRSVCTGLLEWKAEAEIIFAREGGRMVITDVLPLFPGFIAKLDSTKAAELEDTRLAWLEQTRLNVQMIERGEAGAAWDPLETVPPMSAADELLMGEFIASLPECQAFFAAPTPTAQVSLPTPNPGGLPFPVHIDYSTPSNYVTGGPQSTFTAEDAALVKAAIGPVSQDLAGLGVIYRWVAATFRGEPAGGREIGKTTVTGMLASRVVTGCHDSALITAAVMRLFGIPAVMVDTAGLQWVEDFNAGRTMAHAGHVMVEAFVGGRWILVDCTTGRYVAEYDPAKPVIAPAPVPAMDAKGFYVLYKGVDPASYGVTSSAVLAQRFVQFSQAARGQSFPMTAYSWQPLP